MVPEEHREDNVWTSFRDGLTAGLVFTLIGIVVSIYVLNSLGFLAVSFSGMPIVHDFLYWVDANLRLSVVPFTAVLFLYGWQLRRLNILAANPDSPPERVERAEKWVDSSASLFFGVGVIWTAIGMRSALLAAIGGLDQDTAAQLGAFEILRRLVDGGILLALSTTIVGAVGGYLMRLGKTVVAGINLEAFHNRLAEVTMERLERRLMAIEGYLARITASLVGYSEASGELGEGSAADEAQGSMPKMGRASAETR